MAVTFALKIMTFIKDAWVPSPLQILDGVSYKSELKGDNRGFQKEATSFRTAQYITMEFNNNGGTWNSTPRTGESVERITTIKNGNVRERKATAGTENITAKVIASSLTGGAGDYYTLSLKNATSIPLIPGAPKINYAFNLTVRKNGTITLEGEHDGFPSYEVYARVSNGGWQTIYQFNQKNLIDLFGDGDTKVNVTRDIL
ncbi:DUF3238 domain-containing protein [Paenibacillus dauci]|uniref:DUF3238 domain-containing protein n=1 Tax=Paenibacillus dauci TaxID=1567106 RepID=UPI000619C7C5|nr:DUF3238 domain-containing protein [Paenibacillus dauci]